MIRSGLFPEILKKSEVTPVFKKGDPTSKTNYLPVSTLSDFSKIFEKLIYLQLNNYMQNKFSIYLTGFRKNHGTQHALLKMTETWKTKLNMGHKVRVIYMDLSKASCHVVSLHVVWCQREWAIRPDMQWYYTKTQQPRRTFRCNYWQQAFLWWEYY